MAAKGNPIIQIAARAIEALACGNLDYKDERNGYKSRAEAAADLFDGVLETGTPGFYIVKSGDEETPKKCYRVHALAPDFSCECDDALHGKSNRTGLCKHIISAVLYHAAKEVVGEWEDEGTKRGPAPPARTVPTVPKREIGKSVRVPLDDPELEAMCNVFSANNYDPGLDKPQRRS